MNPGLVAAIVIFVIAGIVVLIVLAVNYGSSSSSRNTKSNYQQHKEPRQLSYKQQMYLNSLKGDESSPYSGAVYNISQSAYDAFSDFIKEVFGYEKGSEESKHKIYLMIKKGYSNKGNFRVLPDGDKDITFPRTSTAFLDRSHDFAMREFMTLDENHIVFFFNDSGSDLSKLLKLYFKKTNIEYRYVSRIKPFSAKTNCFVVLDINSEEIAMVYYLVRFYTKNRATVGFKRPAFPSQKTFNQFRIKTMEKYKLQNEYEFMRYLISYFVPCELVAKTFFSIRPPKIQAIRDVANNNPGKDKSVMKHYREIEKELLSEIKSWPIQDLINFIFLK